MGRLVWMLLCVSGVARADGVTCIDGCRGTGTQTSSDQSTTTTSTTSTTTGSSDSDSGGDYTGDDSHSSSLFVDNPFSKEKDYSHRRTRPAPAGSNYISTIDAHGTVIAGGRNRKSQSDVGSDYAAAMRRPIPLLGTDTRGQLKFVAEQTAEHQVDDRAKKHHEMAANTLRRAYDILDNLFTQLANDPTQALFDVNLDTLPDPDDPGCGIFSTSFVFKLCTQ